MIHVIGDYYIDIDAYNYTAMFDLHKTYFNKQLNKDVPQYKDLGYYKNAYGCCEKIMRDMVERKVKENEITTIKQYIEELKEAQKIMENVFNGLNLKGEL